MSQAMVKYITNGYTVNGTRDVPLGEVSQAESHYAATLTEAVFWVGQIVAPTPLAARASAARTGLGTLAASDDPLMNQEAFVVPLTTGGFIVRQMVNVRIPERLQSFDIQCFDMDQVAAALTDIYTPPQTPPAALLKPHG